VAMPLLSSLVRVRRNPFALPVFALIAVSILSCQSKPPAATERLILEPDDTLREYAEHAGLLMGVFAQTRLFSNENWGEIGGMIGREFNLQGSEPCLWRDTEPSEGVFDFSKEEAMDSFALNHGMALKSAAGPWHALNPPWLEAKSFEELGPVMQRHIEAAMGRHRGAIKIWEVCNEIVNDEGTGFRNRQSVNSPDAPFRRSIWVNGSDTSLVKEAFRTARSVDPDALLFLNDFNNEEYISDSRDFGKEKGKFFYEYVTALKKEGVPIDGVGFQLHLNYPSAPWQTDVGPTRLNAYLGNVERNVKRYAVQGLLVEFSEVDVAIKLSDLDLATEKGKTELQKRLVFQAKVYEGLMRVALDNRNVIAFFVWGIGDKYHDTAPSGYGKPLLFDEELRPKLAYYGLLTVLKAKAMIEGPQESRIK
jgi:endo-1,4-beta-xylanase